MDGGRVSRRRNQTLRRTIKGTKTRDTNPTTTDADELHDAGPTNGAANHAPQHANVATTSDANEMVTTRGD